MKAPDESFKFFFSGEKFKEGVKTLQQETVLWQGETPLI